MNPLTVAFLYGIAVGVVLQLMLTTYFERRKKFRRFR